MSMALDHVGGLQARPRRSTLTPVLRKCAPHDTVCELERAERARARRERALRYPPDSSVIRLDAIEAELDKMDTEVQQVVGTARWVAAQ